MPRVLLVDDMPDNLYYLEVLLKGNGFETVSTSNGAEALAAAHATPPDLVISDILMPEMDGYAFCREWRADERLKEIPFIFYTATFVEKKDEELALSLGADRFLIKPLDPGVLMRHVCEVISATSKGMAPAREAEPDEMELLKGYNEALFRKLSKKMADLEQVNRELSVRIEEQKRLEEQLRHAQKMEAVGRFSAGIAHDFNNILTVIFSYGGIMRMTPGLDDAMRAKLDHILEAAERAKNLAGSLLTFSRKQPIRLQRLDVNETLTGVETFLRRVIGDDVTLTLTLSAGILPVLADKGHLEQVLMNLAANARDAMPRGGTLSIGTSRVVVDADFIKCHGSGTPGDYVQISVSDTGSGMDEATRQHIFEPFFTTKDVKGTGLGLSIVYGIVHQHGGHIDVESEAERGTTFRILLPVAETGAGADRTRGAGSAIVRGTETLLVVDDEKPIRECLDMFLTALGYRVYQACDGREAVALFRDKEKEIDLVLMDVIMPQMLGKEAGEEIRRIKQGMKILFISGYSFDAITDEDLLLDGVELLMKPLTPSEVAKKVRAVLDA